MTQPVRGQLRGLLQTVEFVLLRLRSPWLRWLLQSPWRRWLRFAPTFGQREAAARVRVRFFWSAVVLPAWCEPWWKAQRGGESQGAVESAVCEAEWLRRVAVASGWPGCGRGQLRQVDRAALADEWVESCQSKWSARGEQGNEIVSGMKMDRGTRVRAQRQRRLVDSDGEAMDAAQGLPLQERSLAPVDWGRLLSSRQ